MSVSKLESLPNEILVDIFEKYINGMDILVAFLYQQNQRFDALISQCQRFHFSFLYCRKGSFRFCISLLPAYVERIEELALSDQHTPGQIHAFLSFFPSFIVFKRLRKLYFHYNAETIDGSVVRTAFQSLYDTVVDTISIKAVNTDWAQTMHSLFDDMLRLTTIKRIFFTSDFCQNRRNIWNNVFEDQWNFMTGISSKIEYLTIFGMTCGFHHLKSIFQCAPQLKYLNVQLTSSAIYGIYHALNSPPDSSRSISNLHTLILSSERDDSTTFDMLAEYLRVMPALRRLEIKAHGALLDASAWEALLQTSLPSLTHFGLQTTTSRMKKDDIDSTLASFETPFWISKQIFYMILTQHKGLSYNRFGMDEAQLNHQNEFDQPVVKQWIVPFRSHIDNIPTNGITSVCMSNVTSSLSSCHYFENIKILWFLVSTKDI